MESVIINILRILTRKKAPSNKTPKLTKSTNMGICIVGTSTLHKRFLNRNKIFKK